MGKISIVAAKYIIHASIEVDGIVDKPDVIGAIFGQTEGLLGSDLELRELQRGGRIGRIEVSLETKGGKTSGTLTIPSSLDKAETAIIGAALEIIERIGPCDAKIRVDDIEDIRVAKRKYIIERAKKLLSSLMEKSIPDSQEMAEEVAQAVRIMEIQKYGKENLAAGPAIDESDEIIVVEGRADVITMLKHGFKNVIAMNGNSVPQTIIDLSKKKITTVFIDGDRGGELNLKQLLSLADVDFVAIAPDGKEVEELTKKEIHKCLRNKITAEQFSLEHNLNLKKKDNEKENKKEPQESNQSNYQKSQRVVKGSRENREKKNKEKGTKKEQQFMGINLSKEEKEMLKEKIEELIGTKAAYILDKNLSILGKIPLSELENTLEGIKEEIYAIVLDGTIDKELADTINKTGVKIIVALDKEKNARINRGVVKTYDEL